MTESKCKRKRINLQEIFKEDTDSLKQLLREVPQGGAGAGDDRDPRGRERGEDLGPARIPLGLLQPIRALAVETHELWLEASRYLNMALLKEHKKLQLSLVA
jgi:hypothetical protein